jgi:hypothetical protein
MPKNKTLIGDIESLAATLKLDGVVTEGLNNEALVALKKELKSQVDALPKADEPKADEPKADEPKADEPKADEPKADETKGEGPTVAPGKSLMTKRGILGEGAEVRVSDFGNGQDSLDKFIESGHILK